MMKRPLSTILLIGLAVGIASCGKSKPSNAKGEDVIVLCGGSMRGALEELKKRYEAISDDTILPTYGGSGDLCAQIQNTGRGDLYLCHDPFMPWAKKQGVISEWGTVAAFNVVIIVSKDNPYEIKTLKDLAKPGIRLGLGNRTYSTSGQIVKHMLKQETFGAAILKNVRTETKGHQSRCNDVAMGILDASIVWNAVAHLYEDKLKIIPMKMSKYDAITSATYDKSRLDYTKVTLGIITGAKDRDAVKKFYAWVMTEGLQVFEEHHFSPIQKSLN